MGDLVLSARYVDDIASAIKVKLGSSLQYTPSQMAAAIAQITGQISGSITPSVSTDKMLFTGSDFDDIARAIQAKLNTQDTYLVSEMAAAILSITGGGPTPAEPFYLFQQSDLIHDAWGQASGHSANASYAFRKQNDGTWIGSQGNNITDTFSPPIPKEYNYILFDIFSSGRNGAYNLSTCYLRTEYGVTGAYGGNFAGSNLKTITFCNYSSSKSAIESQDGVTISVDGPYACLRQIVVVDVSSITQDMYISWHRCDNATNLYNIIGSMTPSIS